MSSSEITLAGGVGGEEHGGEKRGRSKSRGPSKGGKDMGDVDTRLMKVELSVADGEDKFREMDLHLEELDGRIDELRQEMMGALDEAAGKCSQQCETSSNSLSSEILILKEENKALKEELGNMREEMVLLKKALAHDGGSTSSVPTPTPSRMEVPKPKTYKGGRNAKEVDNFLWSLEQYFRAANIMEDAMKIDHASLYLEDTAMLWWRRRHGEIEKGVCTIDTWEEFKKELKRQFYPENVGKEARARLRRLTQKGSIREYVKEFSEVLLEIPDYPDKEAFYNFCDGLQNWAKLEIERRGAQDLSSAIAIAESLTEFKKSESIRPKGSKGHGGGASKPGSSKPTYREKAFKGKRDEKGGKRPPLK